MALLVKLFPPFGRIRVNLAIPAVDFGRKGELAVEVPASIAFGLSGKQVPQYRTITLPPEYQLTGKETPTPSGDAPPLAVTAALPVVSSSALSVAPPPAKKTRTRKARVEGATTRTRKAGAK